MATRRREIWIALLVLPVLLLIAAIGGLFVYMVVSATPYHTDAQKVPSVVHSTPSPQWATTVGQARQIVRAALIEKNLPGLSVAVGVDDDLVWAEGFGWADLEKRARVTPDTLFRIGTVSTALTSAGVGVLLENGQLKLDDVIQTYVPEYPQKQWPVTLRQLMGHLGGVRTDWGDEEPLSPASGCGRTIEGLRRFANDPLLFEPGTRFSYSTYGWILVSAAVEAASKESFFTFMRDQVFEPLGMRDTMADSATEAIPGRANFYFPRFVEDTRYGDDGPREIDLSCFTGSSTFLSTPSDLVRFGMAINGGKLLQPATIRLLQTSQRLPSGEETGYGLGWGHEHVTLSGADTRGFGHDGRLMGGMVASFMTFPEPRIVVAVTSNIAHAKTAPLAKRIAQLFAEHRRTPARK